MSDSTISRRELIRRSGVLGSLVALPGLHTPDARHARGADPGLDDQAIATPVRPGSGTTGLRPGPEIYESIGVRPLVNARGTFTIVSGSLLLPEVRAAMDAASRHYVHLDELAEAIGARLATLTGAEWGLVTSGCSAALTHATAACVAGGNPDLHVRIPNLAGFQKDEVIIPKHSRNVYDAAVRTVGVRVIEVTTIAELESALGPRTAMIYVLAGPNADGSPLNVKAMAPLARAAGVPILVDAAAEILTIPNVHLQNGASLVGYSGGKCLRGPQAAGLLLGRKDLVRAAWVHHAPHHGYSRSMKVGKEEAIGMLMAVEMWTKRDYDAEMKVWGSWLEQIAKRVSAIDGVTSSIAQPTGLSNRTPTLRLRWDRQRIAISGDAVAKILFDTAPRIVTAGGGAGGAGAPATATGISITPYMLSPGDEKIIGDRLYAILSSPPASPAATVAAPAADLTGQWDVRIDFVAGTSSRHGFFLRQRGNDLDGSHRGDFVSRDLTGTIDGDTVMIRSNYGESNGDALSFAFSGKVTGDEMGGPLDMGEYLTAKWTATRKDRGRRQ
jgi:L-seryl-tRNA(Ser) seleniumtransferase